MNIQYKFRKNNTILFHRCDGEVSKQGFLEFLTQLYADDRFSHIEFLVTDFSSLRGILSEQDVFDIVQHIQLFCPVNKNIRHVLLVQEPLHTALLFLFKHAMKDALWYQCSVVSTYKAAASAVDLPDMYLEQALHELSDTSFKLAQA